MSATRDTVTTPMQDAISPITTKTGFSMKVTPHLQRLLSGELGHSPTAIAEWHGRLSLRGVELPPLDADAVWTVSDPSRGLGDLVAKGIHFVTSGKVKPCGGCKKRQGVLNKIVPFRSKRTTGRRGSQQHMDPGLPLDPLPFTGPITRHLHYFVWPVSGNGTWEHNLNELLKRIDLFNGRRRIGIVTSADADHPDAVKDYLKGHDCEFVIAPNNKKKRETLLFLPLLAPLKSTDPNEVIFFAHAKGVRHATIENQGTTVHRWTQAMYETCLDDLQSVDAALIGHAFAGSFKRYGQFATPKNHRWHYSGTFYWARSAFVFARDWNRIDRKFFGSESWPGLVVPSAQGACLFCDNAPDLYKMREWEQRVQQEWEQWKQLHSVIA